MKVSKGSGDELTTDPNKDPHKMSCQLVWYFFLYEAPQSLWKKYINILAWLASCEIMTLSDAVGACPMDGAQLPPDPNACRTLRYSTTYWLSNRISWLCVAFGLPYLIFSPQSFPSYEQGWHLLIYTPEVYWCLKRCFFFRGSCWNSMLVFWHVLCKYKAWAQETCTKRLFPPFSMKMISKQWTTVCPAPSYNDI